MIKEARRATGHTRWLWKILVTLFCGGILLILAPWSTPLAGFGKQYISPEKCSGSEQETWRQRNFKVINQQFESIESDFSVEVIKAIAWYESEWQHMDSAGQTIVNGTTIRRSNQRRKTYDVGIMQINEDSHGLNQSLWDLERIKIDPIYNIAAGVRVLENKRNYVRYLKRRKDWSRIEAKYNMAGHSELEMTLKAYNGFRRSWVYPEKINQLIIEKPWEKAMVRQHRKKNLQTNLMIIETHTVTPQHPYWQLQPTKLLSIQEDQAQYQMIHVLDEAL